jgi:hypothetical protein
MKRKRSVIFIIDAFFPQIFSVQLVKSLEAEAANREGWMCVCTFFDVFGCLQVLQSLGPNFPSNTKVTWHVCPLHIKLAI